MIESKLSRVLKRCALILALLIFSGTTVAATATATAKFSFGRFGEATIYKPDTVRHVALFFSDLNGWSAVDAELAQDLANDGILVAGIDLRHYAAELSKPRDKCSYLAGEFEDFSHELQKRFSPARYHLPVLIGDGVGAALVYAVAAQGSSGTFIGTATLRFHPHWRPPLKLCQSYELSYTTSKDGSVTLQPSHLLSTPWIALHAGGDQTISEKELRNFTNAVGTARTELIADNRNATLRDTLLAAVDKLALPDREPKIVADDLRDLTIEEVRAPAPSASRLALFLTGDGGWAEIDKGVSNELSKLGIDVIALSSLQYFWKPRSPDETAKDVARILRHYLAAWQKQDVLVIGYSFGADVAPFVVNRLPDELRRRIASVNLLGLATTADFEVHVTTWLGVDHHGLPTRPEVERLPMRVLCIYGKGEKDSQCATLTGPGLRSVQIGDGHHFGDRYKELADAIVAAARAP